MDWSVRDWAHRVVGAEQEAGQGGAEWGDMTRGKRSGDEDDDSADQNEITEMEVSRRPDWRPRRSGGETGMEDREGEEQRDRLMARRRRRIWQI